MTGLKNGLARAAMVPFCLTPPDGSVGNIRIDRPLYLNHPSPERLAEIIQDQSHLPDDNPHKKTLVFVFGDRAEKRAQKMSDPSMLTRGILVEDYDAMTKLLTGLAAQGISTQGLFYEDGPRAKRAPCPVLQGAMTRIKPPQQFPLF